MPLKTYQSRKESSDAGMFYSGFKIVARYARLIGVCFFENLDAADYRDLRHTRKCFYSVLTIFLWLLEGFDALFCGYYYAQCSDKLSRVDYFNALIYLLFVGGVSGEGLLCFLTAFFNGPGFQKLIRTCAYLEFTIRPPAEATELMVYYAWKCIFLQASQVVFCIALFVTSEYGMMNMIGKMEIPYELDVCSALSCWLYLLHVTTQCLINRVWMAYFYRAFRVYIACITQDIDVCLRSTTIPYVQKTVLLEQYRTTLHLIKMTTRQANSLLGPSLVFAYAYTACLLCVSLCYTFISHTAMRIRVFFLGFGALHWVCILLPTLAASRISDDISELRSIIQSASIAHAPRDMVQQVSMLLSMLNPRDFMVNVYGMFVIELPTLTQIFGAVVTYSVVLVQTNSGPGEQQDITDIGDYAGV